MKVWIVISQETEEPYILLGVYTSEEKASADWNLHHEEHNIIECELDNRLKPLVTHQEAWDKHKAKTDAMLKAMLQ